jgi:hypothetical protein
MPPCALTAACLARTGAIVKMKKPPTTKTDRDSITKDEASRAPAAIARVVERNITRFFGNNLVPAAAIDVVVDDEGFTMRNRMNKDREELLDSGKKRADPSYFMDVKRKYMQLLTGVKVAAVDDTSDPVPEALAHALTQARGKYRRGRKRDPIVHYLWSCRAELNQASVVDVVNFIIESQQVNCLQQAMLVVEMFRHLIRLDMMEKFQAELSPAMPVLEEALRTIYAHESRQAEFYDFSAFWDKYKDTAKCFVKDELVKQVLSESSDISKCLGPLSALATGSSLGADLFLPSCPFVVGAHVNSAMREMAEELVSATLIDTNLVNDTVVKMVAVAERLKFDTLVGAYDVKYKFMGVEFEHQTHTAIEQARLHVAGVIRTVAVSRGELEPLQVVSEVHPIKVVKDATKSIDEAVLAVYRPAQSAVASEMRRATYTTAASVVTHMESLKSVWWSRDPTIVLEIGLLRALAGPAGATKLMEKALAILPQGSVYQSYGKVRADLQGLETTKAWLFASAPARGRVIAIMDIISAMERGEGPYVSQFPAKSDMETASKLLANFITYQPAASSKGVAVTLFGLEALKAHLKDLKAAVTDGTITDLSLATKCQTYAWLLTEAERTDLDTLAEKAYEKVVGKVGAVPAAAVGGAMDVMVAAAHSAKVDKDKKQVH